MSCRRNAGSVRGTLARSSGRKQGRVADELEQPMDRSEAALQHVAIVAAQERWRQLRTTRASIDADARLLPEEDPQRSSGVAEDRFVLRHEGPGGRQTLAGGGSEDRPRRHTE